MQTIRKGIEKTFSLPSRGLFYLLMVFTLTASFAHAGSTTKIINQNSGAEFSNLQLAINEANSGDTLKVKGHAVGLFTITKNLTIYGDSATLDGTKEGSVVTIFTPAGAAEIVTVTLRNLTIQNGLGADPQGGGGILNINANLILQKVKVLHNESLANGGGILNATITTSPDLPPFSLDFQASLALSKCKVSYNRSVSGGGITNIGGNLVIEFSKISGNLATQAGGGILSVTGQNVINNSKISSNTATLQGGGLENLIGSVTALSNVKFINNHGGQGGGVYNGSGGLAASSVVLNECSFHGNNTFTAGGGIFNDIDSSASLSQVKITRNSGLNAGGIFNNTGAVLNLSEVDVQSNIPNNIVNLNP